MKNQKKRKYSTPQENFWAGKFGSEYIQRNNSAEQLASSISLYGRIFSNLQKVQSLMEYGANIGINLRAIKYLCPGVHLSAVEINSDAVKYLKLIDEIAVYNESILDFSTNNSYDMVICQAVLIHIQPSKLHKVYDLLYRTTNKYICLVEYYSPYPTMVSYRGYTERLFKRDFCGELLNKYHDLRLVDYGFIYHNDNNFQFDDLNWFVLEKLDG
jgi:spore coat polysaccharide biosynthesis protein SpsF